MHLVDVKSWPCPNWRKRTGLQRCIEPMEGVLEQIFKPKNSRRTPKNEISDNKHLHLLEEGTCMKNRRCCLHKKVPQLCSPKPLPASADMAGSQTIYGAMQSRRLWLETFPTNDKPFDRPENKVQRPSASLKSFLCSTVNVHYPGHLLEIYWPNQRPKHRYSFLMKGDL